MHIKLPVWKNVRRHSHTQDRIAYGTFHGIDPDRKGPSGYKVVPAGASSAPTAGRPAPLGPRRVKRRRSDEDGAVGEDDDEEVGYTANRLVPCWAFTLLHVDMRPNHICGLFPRAWSSLKEQEYWTSTAV